MRVLPAFRFFTPEALRHGWEPTKFIPERIYQKFPSPLATKCIFLRVLPQRSMPAIIVSSSTVPSPDTAALDASNEDGIAASIVDSAFAGHSRAGCSNDDGIVDIFVSSSTVQSPDTAALIAQSFVQQ
jgi:hypothetical protein